MSNVWPTATQKDLLVAALLGDAAAFTRWIGGVDAENLDAGSQRLLPLLYRTLRDTPVSHPFLQRCKGFFRYTWYRNQTRLFRTEALVRELGGLGIPTLLLKGTALAGGCYADLGSRPMEDTDVAVPRAMAPQALSHLRQRGFRTTHFDLPEHPPATYYRSYHGCDLIDDAGYRLDLHWHPLIYATMPSIADTFWRHAVPVRLKDVQVLVPSHTDLLLQVLVHGLQYNEVPSIRWVADACVLIRQGRVDWSRLVQQTTVWNLTLPVADGLGFIRREFDVAVPQEVLQTLKQARVSALERLGYAAQLLPYQERTLLGTLANRYAAYTRSEIATYWHPRWLGFFEYMRGMLSLDSYPQILRRGLKRLARR